MNPEDYYEGLERKMVVTFLILLLIPFSVFAIISFNYLNIF